MISFLAKRSRELNSPIIQVFMRPFSRPWVVLTDGREYVVPTQQAKGGCLTQFRAMDIMTRRGREFDRSNFFGDLLISLVPNNQGTMLTNDQWRWNRKLVADVMDSRFLETVAAHNAYDATMDLVELWKQKARLAGSHAFDITEDMKMCTFDVLWSVTFGPGIRSCKAQSDLLSKLDHLDHQDDGLAVIPGAKLPEFYGAMKMLIESSQIPMTSPLGRWHHWFVCTFYPSFIRAQYVRDKLVNGKIAAAWKRFEESDPAASEAMVKCALDLIVEKEVKLAKKEGRKPDHNSKYLHDELCGFLSAGIDTAASTISWGLKYLTKHQDTQTKLRRSLRETHKQAVEAGRPPTAEELAKIKTPYLEAFIDEVMRHSGVVSANIRVALQDSVVLGHVIPKGVDVFMITNGPSMKEPAFPIDENLRSQSSKDFKGDAGGRIETTSPSSNLSAGSRRTPRESLTLTATFGLGVRSCYGKKLAYLEMRVIYALIVWNFELLPVSDSLSDWKAQDVLTHQVQNSRVRLAEVKV
ncbi:Cytochrome P450 monooxygenase [Pseudocercospora fuligena]|uniref:Cytochrome P450 monooxygenase n=1 Tax=Pseudocercospora fuligena TaxID=685502 RepID=A0A8H6VIT4_9PEZI|nr:Cytochrome P450 monooxygenase [Pseudocercospora fuligena]